MLDFWGRGERNEVFIMNFVRNSFKHGISFDEDVLSTIYPTIFFNLAVTFVLSNTTINTAATTTPTTV